MREQYHFTDLEDNPDLLNELQALEQKIADQIGTTVTLIAYTPNREDTSSMAPS